MDDIANAIDILQEMNVPQGQQAKVDAAIRSLKKAHKEAGHFQRNWKAYAGGAGALGVAGLGLGAKYAYDKYLPRYNVRKARERLRASNKANAGYAVNPDSLLNDMTGPRVDYQRRRGRRVAKAGMPPRDPRTGRFLKRKRR